MRKHLNAFLIGALCLSDSEFQWVAAGGRGAVRLKISRDRRKQHSSRTARDTRHSNIIQKSCFSSKSLVEHVNAVLILMSPIWLSCLLPQEGTVCLFCGCVHTDPIQSPYSRLVILTLKIFTHETGNRNVLEITEKNHLFWEKANWMDEFTEFSYCAK